MPYSGRVSGEKGELSIGLPGGISGGHTNGAACGGYMQSRSLLCWHLVGAMQRGSQGWKGHGQHESARESH